VLCLGGRFSRFLAGILQRCLHHMRDGSVLLDGTGADLVDELATIGRRHVLVVFDYRRYQADIVRFAEQAKALGAVVILYTDVWKSPISNFADIVLVAPTATASPFDTLATPLLQVEAMAAGVAHRLGGNWRARAALLEGVRSKNHVTLDGSDRPARHHKERPKT
jgi:DNA-binding MurR/RpiR family transcriptional regulator